MSRTLDKYGANIRNVNLQQKLNELGIQANISALNQNDKALLRTIILLENTKYAWGDNAQTLNRGANQLRMLKSNFANLSRTIGNIFLPTVAAILPYINGLVVALQRLAERIVKLLGNTDFDWGGTGGADESSLSYLYDDADQLSDNLDDAASSAKKLKNELMGFDEINKLSDNTDDTSNTSTGGLDAVGQGLLNSAFNKVLSDYQTAWDKAFDNIESKADMFANNIEKKLKNVSKILKPTTNAFKKLWDDGLKNVFDFGKTGLEDFYNEFLVPIGKWTLGKGLPMLIETINSFLKKINWNLINNNLKTFWKIIEPFAEGIGEGLIGFLRKYSQLSASAINLVSIAIGKILNIISLVPESVIKGFGKVLGELIGVFLAFRGLVGIGAIISNFGTAFSGMFTMISKHPYAALIASIAALSAEIYDFFSNPIILGANTNEIIKNMESISDETKKSIDEVNASIQSYYDTSRDTIAKYDYIKDVANKYIELSQNYTNLTDEQKNLLVAYSDILKDNVQGVEEFINPITGAYEGTKDELNDLIDTTKKYYLVLGAKEKLTEFGTELANIQISMSEKIQELNNILAKPIDTAGGYQRSSYIEWAEDSYDRISDLGFSYGELLDALERVGYRYESLTDTEKKHYKALLKHDEIFADYMSRIGTAPNDLYELQQSASKLENQMSSLNEIVATNGASVVDVASSGIVQITKVKNSVTGATESINSNFNDMGKTFTAVTNQFPQQMSTALNNTQKNNINNASNTGLTLSKYMTLGFSNLSTLLSRNTTTALNVAKNTNNGNATNAGNSLQNNFANGFSNINLSSKVKNSLVGMYNDNYNTFNSYGNELGKTFGDGIKSGFDNQKNGILNNIQEIFGTVEPIFNAAGAGLKLKFGFGAKAYATGGFPEDGLFFANHNELVGQFSNGRTAVANNEQITTGIEEASYRGMMRALSESQGNQNVTIKVEGDATGMFKVMQRQANDYMIRTGMVPFPT